MANRRIPTKEQQRALLALYRRYKQSDSYLRFRRNAYWEYGSDPALIVPWCGMCVGIEPDGYTHT